jgi:CubicO group peptidase (beta-lactamase class C family)
MNINIHVKTIFLCIVLVSTACKTQENRSAVTRPEKVGMSSERLSHIKPAMQKYIDGNKLPGLITLVARHGRIVYSEVYGLAVESPELPGYN